jgi:hypothetical protein
MSYKETDVWNVIWSPGVDLHTNKQLMSDKGISNKLDRTPGDFRSDCGVIHEIELWLST